MLHTVMLEILDHLEREFEVKREEGYGLDDELERNFEMALPTVRLTPADPDAAPITVVFSAFPGLNVRFGKWWQELLPACGCDACAESGEKLAEELKSLTEDVTAGRFREVLRSDGPWKVWSTSAWQELEIWGASGRRRGRNRRVAKGSSGRQQMDWQPWPRFDGRQGL